MEKHAVRDSYARQIHGELATMPARERLPRPATAANSAATPAATAVPAIALAAAALVLTRVLGRIAAGGR
jgi:hypothetical protein